MLSQDNLNNEYIGQAGLLSRLPTPSFGEFVGARGYGRTLREFLLHSDNDIVVVSGPAGIGKTSTINHTVRQLLAEEDIGDIAWISGEKPLGLNALPFATQRPLTRPMLINKLVQQWRLTQSTGISAGQLQFLVKEYLQANNCLVVIDNLAEEDDLQELLPLLRKWKGPSKFVIGIEQCHKAEDCLLIGMAGFDPAGSKDYLQSLSAQAHTGDSTFLPALYGNPLAIKLAQAYISLVGRQHLDFISTNSIPFHILYDLLWDYLDDEAKTILLGLMDSGEQGFIASHLQEICGLPNKVVKDSLIKLQKAALVTKQDDRFVLHKKTQHYFLQKLMEIS